MAKAKKPAAQGKKAASPAKPAGKRIRKPLTPEQRKRKNELARKRYRAAKKAAKPAGACASACTSQAGKDGKMGKCVSKKSGISCAGCPSRSQGCGKGTPAYGSAVVAEIRELLDLVNLLIDLHKAKNTAPRPAPAGLPDDAVGFVPTAGGWVVRFPVVVPVRCSDRTEAPACPDGGSRFADLSREIAEIVERNWGI